MENPKGPLATIGFTLLRESEVELLFQVGAGQPVSITGIPDTNPQVMGPGTTSLGWDFDGEQGLSSSFVDDVLVFARIRGVQDDPVDGDNAVTLGLGNDAPVVTALPRPVIDPDEGEGAGLVLIEVELQDSSDDVVSTLVEFDVQGDAPDAGFQAATGFGLDSVPVSRNGQIVPYFWDTDVDLADRETDVVLCFTPSDPVATGATEPTAPFRVDNNEEPIVQLFSDLFVATTDVRRGIPIPFQLIDEENNLVDLIFQWRRPNENFPELPTDAAALDDLLSDPVQRRLKHVCTEHARYARGRVVPVDPITVRLPELALSESWILAAGIEGLTLELLRPSRHAPVIRELPPGTLEFPIAALPLERSLTDVRAHDGLTALVLDSPGGNSRLREIQLTTGEVLREVATLAFGPTAMAFEGNEQRAVLIATFDSGGDRRIERVELANGAHTELLLLSGDPADEPIRGLASLGPVSAVFTNGPSLLHLDYWDALAVSHTTLLGGLETPWGVVVDPLQPQRILVAERDAVTPDGTGRILAVELNSRGRLPVVVNTSDLELDAIEHPTALAAERSGSRVLVATNSSDEEYQLFAIDVGANGANLAFPIGAPETTEISSVGIGSDGLRTAVVPDDDLLIAYGGVEQRRTISDYEHLAVGTGGQRVTIAEPFDPTPRQGQEWRIRAEFRGQAASAEGSEGTFVWSTAADLPSSGGPTFLRGIPWDDEVGIVAAGRAPKNVRAALDVEPVLLGDVVQPIAVAAGDVDDDGDLDLVSVDHAGSQLAVFQQTVAGSFDLPSFLALPPGSVVVMVTTADINGDGRVDLIAADRGRSEVLLLLDGALDWDSIPMPGAGVRAVAAVDIDRDSRMDLVTANADSHTLTVLRQTSPGNFVPLSPLGNATVTSSPSDVVTADLDGNGLLDIVSANEGSANLAVFFQRTVTAFDPAATLDVPEGGKCSSEAPRDIAVSDFDANGLLDLACANSGGNQLAVFRQLVPGTFEPASIMIDVPGGDECGALPTSVAAGDLDGDGRADLVCANLNDDSLSVFFQGQEGLELLPLTLRSPALVRPQSVRTADLDGDGDLDLFSTLSSGPLTVFFQAAPGSFELLVTTIGPFDEVDNPFAGQAVDIDRDGDLDLVSANADSSNLTVFRQTSPRVFDAEPMVLHVMGEPRSVIAADLDCDGNTDVVSGSSGSFAAVFFQGASHQFEEPIPLAFPSSPDSVSVAAADIDGNGYLDVVAADDDRLIVHFQDAVRSFASNPLQLSDSAAQGLEFVIAADVDGDGKVDLAVAAEEALAVFYQENPTLFTSSTLMHEDLRSPEALVAADLDADGDLDLASVNFGGQNITVFFQDSPRVFAPDPVAFGDGPELDEPHALASADVDGDGDLDLASAETGTGKLAVFFQYAPTRFDVGPLVLDVLSSAEDPCFIVAADIDMDGEIDLFSTHDSRDSLTILWGGR